MYLTHELFEVRRVGQPDLLALFERRIRRQPIAQCAPDGPERTDANGRRAVNEHRTIRRFVGDLQERLHVRVGRIPVNDRDVEVLHPGRLDRGLLVRRAMFGGLPQVEHGLHAIRLELRKSLESRLGASAELRADLEELRDRRQLGLSWGLKERRE